MPRMPKPLAKPRKLLLAMTDADHAALTQFAAGRPLGPAIVERALRPDPAPATVRSAYAALVTAVDALDRYGPHKAPLQRLLPALAPLVRDA